MKTMNDFRLEILDMIERFGGTEEEQIDMVRRMLQIAKNKIEFLEGIYTSSSKYSFTERFKDCAYGEKQELCQFTSACYDMLRNAYHKEVD